MMSNEDGKTVVPADKVCLGCNGFGWYYLGPRGDTPKEIELPTHVCEECDGTGIRKTNTQEEKLEIKDVDDKVKIVRDKRSKEEGDGNL